MGYIVSRYPLLSETFILREMWELERQGWRLRLYPLRRVRGGVRHGRVAALRAPVWVAPWCPGGAHARRLWRQPRVYLRTLAAVFWSNRGDFNLLAGALAYWGKAVALAERLEQDGVGHVHAHYATHPTLVAYVVYRLTGIPYSFTAHAHDLYCHRAMLGKKLEKAAYAVTISRYNQRLLAGAGPPAFSATAAVGGQGSAASSPPTPIHVIHCGVETAVYRERELTVAGTDPAAPAAPALRSAVTILIPAEAPIRVAPAAIISRASSAVRIPPAALIPIRGPTASRMWATS